MSNKVIISNNCIKNQILEILQNNNKTISKTIYRLIKKNTVKEIVTKRVNQRCWKYIFSDRSSITVTEQNFKIRIN